MEYTQTRIRASASQRSVYIGAPALIGACSVVVAEEVAHVGIDFFLYLLLLLCGGCGGCGLHGGYMDIITPLIIPACAWEATAAPPEGTDASFLEPAWTSSWSFLPATALIRTSRSSLFDWTPTSLRSFATSSAAVEWVRGDSDSYLGFVFRRGRAGRRLRGASFFLFIYNIR